MVEVLPSRRTAAEKIWHSLGLKIKTEKEEEEKTQASQKKQDEEEYDIKWESRERYNCLDFCANLNR